jgi:hypothetical protein
MNSNKILTTLAVIAIILFVLVLSKPRFLGTGTDTTPLENSNETPIEEVASTPPRKSKQVATKDEEVAEEASVAKPATARTNPSEITVSLGQSATLDDITVTFEKIISDSRCPKDSNCIWEGELRTLLTLRSGNESTSTEAILGAPAFVFAGTRISVISVSPEADGSSADPSIYSIVVRIEKPESKNIDMVEAARKCKGRGGVWNQEYHECAGVSEIACTAIQGTWNECASACRHQPEAQMCTMQCELICEFK